MNTTLFKTLALLFLSITLFLACKKNKEEDLPVSETSIAGTYTLGAYTTTSLLGEKDKLSEMDACKRDDLYVLKPNYAFEYQDAGSTCSSPGIHVPLWTLSGNYLTLDGKIYKIEKLSNQQLVVTFDEPLLNILYTSRLVFNRK